MDPQKIIRQNKDVYDTIAADFFRTRQIVWEELKPLAAYASPGDRILDVGCGFGRLLYLFKDKEINYLGIDQSEEQLAIARKIFPDKSFQFAEMTALPYHDQSFDVVYCIAAFHHIPTEILRRRALAEMYRVLAVGGRLIMTNWYLHGVWGIEKMKKKEIEKMGEGGSNDFLVPWKDTRGHELGKRYYHGFTSEELAELCTETGFKVEKNELDPKKRNLITVVQKIHP